MIRCLIFYIFFLLLAGLFLVACSEKRTGSSLEVMPVSELKQQLDSIDAELDQLASYSPRGGSGSVGFTSNPHLRPEAKEWVRIELGAEFPIDQIVLVPSIKRNPGIGIEAEGFPVAFRILAGTENTTMEVAAFTETDRLLPRVAPLVVSFPTLKASWIAVETSILSKRDWDDRHALYFSEILAFSGLQNVALHKPIRTSSSKRSPGRSEKYVVDGFLPYLMDSSSEGKSQAVGFRTNTRSPSLALTIDLETPGAIDQINLHTTDLNRTIPQTAPSDYAVPRQLRIYGANEADFSDQTMLCEYQHNSVYDAGPIIALSFPETVCRYVRVQFLELQENSPTAKAAFFASFAEIEVLSAGRNLALGKPVSRSAAARILKDHQRLTDGHNFFGKILPLREWMNQLARRHDLEALRPLVEAELDLRYQRQAANLRRLGWLAALLVAVIGFSILIVRHIHRSQLERMRNRFAADIHDELGANLHAIGLLGDLAKDAVHSPDDLIPTVDEIRALTERTGLAARHCADIYAAHLCGNPKADMQRTARRILADIEYDLTIENEEQLETMKPRRQADLLLFFKESLVNISRHSGATRCSIRLIAEKKRITLVISDDGIGLSGVIPPSLKRRAKLLSGKLDVESPETGGAIITLRLQRRSGFLRRFSKDHGNAAAAKDPIEE